jgi:hypothetical protein
MKVKFPDGIEVDTSGEFRVEEIDGQFFILGEELMLGVDSREQGEKEIELYHQNKKESRQIDRRFAAKSS